MAKISKVAIAIYIGNKYRQTISNNNIDKVEDLKLTDYKKYQRYICQIQAKVYQLYKDWISLLKAFVKHFLKMYNNKITKNMMIKHDIGLKQTLSLFIQLYESMHHWKIDNKDIANATKLVNRIVQSLLG